MGRGHKKFLSKKVLMFNFLTVPVESAFTALHKAQQEINQLRYVVIIRMIMNNVFTSFLN